MANLEYFSRCLETTTTTGSGTITLNGAITGYQSFGIVGNGNSCNYCIYQSDSNGIPTGIYEVGQGTYGSSGTTLTRGIVYENSSGTTTALSLTAGTYRVMLTPPALFYQGSVLKTRLTNDVTNATTTFSNLTDLSVKLQSGETYTGQLVLKVNNSVAVEGIKIDFNGGAATMTVFWAGIGILSSNGTDTVGTNTSTSLAGVLNYSVLTGETVLIVNISMVCSSGGDFIVRGAENSHSTGTITFEQGSYLTLDNTIN